MPAAKKKDGGRNGGRLLSEAVSSGDAVGDVVDGRYLLMKRAGAGAAGTVWVARDLFRNIDVALKLLRAVNLGKKEIVAHFAREAELAARMHSPHVVRVLGSGRTEAHGPYVVFEHLEGEDLAAMLARKRRLPIVETRTIIVQACRALARAHALGVLHRDIKPSNLFVADGGEGDARTVKILDFGLAELAGGKHDATNVVGTLEYISPEVLFGTSDADARSDLYSLAVVAYECFTGAVPFVARSMEELVVAHAYGRIAPPSTLRAGLPHELDAWFEKALARDPALRFATAKEMVDALDDALACVERAPGFSDGWIAIEPSSTCDSKDPSAPPRTTSGVHPRTRSRRGA